MNSIETSFSMDAHKCTRHYWQQMTKKKNWKNFFSKEVTQKFNLKKKNCSFSLTTLSNLNINFWGFEQWNDIKKNKSENWTLTMNSTNEKNKKKIGKKDAPISIQFSLRTWNAWMPTNFILNCILLSQKKNIFSTIRIKFKITSDMIER